MFWDTKDPPSHNIEILLESPDTKVEVFLEEDNIIQECKTQKKNIVNYFTRPDVVRRMIELITTEPPEEAPISERFRHANVACEILTMGLPSLDEKLLADTDTLNLLYSYLENEPPLNPLLASFFSKTFSMLFTKKSDQDWFLYQQTCLKLLEYLKTKSNFLDLICKHFTTPIVPDLIMEMMQNVEGAQLKRSLYEWLNEERLVEKLIEIIGDPEQSEKHANVADFLCDLIHQGRTLRHDIDTFEPVFGGSDPILQKIESATTLLALFNVILQPNAGDSAIVSGITIVLKIIKPAKVIDERDMERMIGFIEREKEIHEEFLTTVIRVIEPQLKQFNELLKNPPKKPGILTSAANLSPPFGMARLQIVRLFTELLETKNIEISKAISETDFLDILLSLFKDYCWNNFLHREVEKCMFAIFPYSNQPPNNSTSTQEADATKDEDDELNTLIDKGLNWMNNSKFPQLEAKQPESTPSAIQTNAIVNCKIISKLLECWKTNTETESAEKGRRLGYMGHLINIFKHITKCIAESEHIGALIESNLNDDNELDFWKSLVNATDGELTKLLSAQSKLLANHEPCEYNVSLDFFTDNNISDAFNGLCTLMDSSDAFGRSNEFDDADEDDNAAASFDGDGGLSFYVEPRPKFVVKDPWYNDKELVDIVSAGWDRKIDTTNKYLRAYAEMEAYFGGNSSTRNNASDAATDTATVATTSSEEFDNNANVEKSSLWSDEFTSFQIPNKDTQFATNFLDNYENDEGMWTRPLGVSHATATVEQSDVHSVDPIRQTDECRRNLITNGPNILEESEHGPEETPLNQLSNSIEDNTLIDDTVEDITLNENKEEIIKEINGELNITKEKEDEEEKTTSKHNLNKLDCKDTEAENTTTINTNTNQLTNPATAAENISDGSTTTT